MVELRRMLGIGWELAMLVALASPAVAQITLNWSGSTSPVWAVAANWGSSLTPNATVSAVIDTNGAVQPIYTGSPSSSVANLTVGNTSASGSNTELIIQLGLTFGNVTVGNGAGSTGTILVNGTLGQLTGNMISPKTTIIGGAGNGTLVISNGGNVTGGNATVGNLAGAVGLVTVEGAGSKWSLTGFNLNIGQSGNGSLNITSGGNVTSGNGTIGNLAGSSGIVSVDGAGSKWIAGSSGSGTLAIGGAGNGSLSITNGGNVSILSRNVTLGVSSNSNGSVVVDGAGSALYMNNAMGPLTVGMAGNGTLTISNGGNVSGVAPLIVGNQTGSNGALIISNGGILSGVTSVILGNQTGSNGTLTISGSNSSLNFSNPFGGVLTVGGHGNGTLNIEEGASLTANLSIGANGTVNQYGGMVTDLQSNNGLGFQVNGTYNLQGGSLNLGNNQISGSGTFNLAGGTLQVSNATIGFNAVLAAGTSSSITSTASGIGLLFPPGGGVGTISGSGNLQISGNGAIELVGNNTYTGATIVNGTTLDVLTLANGGAVSSIGASSNAASNLVINGGTLEIAYPIGVPASNLTTDRLFTMGGGGATIEAANTLLNNISFTNSGALAFSSPSGTTSTLNLLNFPYSDNSFAPLIGDNGPGGITSVNLTGGWLLSNANTYSGNTTVTYSTLTVDNTSGSASGTGNVVVNGFTSGALHVGQLNGNGSIFGNVFINSGASVTPGNAGVGNLTLGNLTLAANTTLTFNFTSGLSNTQVIVTNANGLAINGSNVNLLNAADGTAWSALGNYTLFDISGSVGGSGLSSLAINNPQPGLVYTFTDNGTAVQVDLSNIVPANNWSASGNGAWDDTANWSALSVPDGIGSVIGFANASAPATVTLDASHIVGDLVFNNSGGEFSLVSAGSNGLTMDNGGATARIDVVTGNATIAAPMMLTGNGLLSLVTANSTLTLSGNLGESVPAALTVGGNGTLVLSGNNTYSGGTVLNYGTLSLGSATALGSGPLIINGGNLVNNSGADLTLADNNPQIWNASFGYLGLNDLNLGNGSVTLGSSVSTGGYTLGGISLNVSGGNLIVNGDITGNASLTKNGDGTLVINGTDPSGIFVYNGTLLLNGQITSDVTLGYPDPSTNSTAALNIQNGGTVSGVFFNVYGSAVGATNLAVTGAGSSVINTGFISLGVGGSVFVNVANGGLISTPFFWVIGANTTLNLESGGTLQLTGSQGIGLQAGSLALNLSGGAIQAATTGLNLSVNGMLADNTTTTIDTDGNATTYSGVLSGNGALAKVGNGVLSLTAANTFLGATTISGGTIALSGAGSLAASSAINLASGNLDVSALNAGGTFTIGLNQTLAGSGMILSSTTGNLAFNGTVSPGVADPINISGGNVSLNGLANFTLNDSSHYSQLSVANALTYGGNLALNLGAALYNGIYNLFSFDSESGDFLGISLTGLFVGSLVDNAGVWDSAESTENFSFSDATGQLTISISFPPGTSAEKQAWLQNNFNINQLTDSGISGDNATPAGDRIPNFFKYAFGLPALAYGRAGLPQPTMVNGSLVLSFTARPDITYTIEASTDLVTWATTGVTVQTNGSQVTASYLLPPGGTAFMHVLVSPSP